MKKLREIIFCIVFITSIGLNVFLGYHIYFNKQINLPIVKYSPPPQQVIAVDLKDDKLNEKVLTISKENFEAAQNYHDSISTLVNTIRILFPLGTFLTLIVLIWGLMKRERILNWLYRELRFEERENINWARISNQQGIQHYSVAIQIPSHDPMHERMVNLAISATEEALHRADIAFQLEPHNKKEEDLLTRIYSNLAYYYAMIKKMEKFSQGWRYARWSLERGEKYPNLNWVENYLFFIKQFADSIPQDERKRAKKVFANYKNTLLAQGICSQTEIDDYERVFSAF